jgi:hypothetical protein
MRKKIPEPKAHDEKNARRGCQLRRSGAPSAGVVLNRG